MVHRAVSSTHGYHVFDTLYSADSKLYPKPQMATGHEISDNQRVWRFRLRDGLKFHDNTPVRSIDGSLSIQRWCKRDPLGQLLDSVVEQWATPDDKTLELHLTRPFPIVLDALAKPGTNLPFIMPERMARTAPMKAITEAIGSGPYRFFPDEYVNGGHGAYERFDGYVPRSEPPSWASGGKIAYFPCVEWNIVPDPATASAALMKGEADWWERPLNDLIPMLERDSHIRTMIHDPSGRLSLLRMNHLQPPFDDVRIRRAVLTAVKQEDYMPATIGDDTASGVPARACSSAARCSRPRTKASA